MLKIPGTTLWTGKGGEELMPSLGCSLLELAGADLVMSLLTCACLSPRLAPGCFFADIPHAQDP